MLKVKEPFILKYYRGGGSLEVFTLIIYIFYIETYIFIKTVRYQSLGQSLVTKVVYKLLIYVKCL